MPSSPPNLNPTVSLSPATATTAKTTTTTRRRRRGTSVTTAPFRPSPWSFDPTASHGISPAPFPPDSWCFDCIEDDDDDDDNDDDEDGDVSSLRQRLGRVVRTRCGRAVERLKGSRNDEDSEEEEELYRNDYDDDDDEVDISEDVKRIKAKLRACKPEDRIIGGWEKHQWEHSLDVAFASKESWWAGGVRWVEQGKKMVTASDGDKAVSFEVKDCGGSRIWVEGWEGMTKRGREGTGGKMVRFAAEPDVVEQDRWSIRADGVSGHESDEMDEKELGLQIDGIQDRHLKTKKRRSLLRKTFSGRIPRKPVPNPQDKRRADKAEAETKAAEEVISSTNAKTRRPSTGQAQQNHNLQPVRQGNRTKPSAAFDGFLLHFGFGVILGASLLAITRLIVWTKGN